MTVVTADSVDDAVRIANDTEYGLSAAVFGRDTDRALERRPDRSGICHVNGSTVHDEPAARSAASSTWLGRFGSGQVADEFTTCADHDLQRGPPLPDLSGKRRRARLRKQRRKCRDRRALRRLNR